MMKSVILLSTCAALSACTGGDTTTSVSGLSGGALVLSTSAHGSNGPAVTASILPASGCPTLADDAVATFDGTAMTVSDAGGIEDSFDGPYCDNIELALTISAPLPGQLSTFTLTDSTGTWTVSGKDLLTDDLATTSALTVGQVATIAWPSAGSDSITGAFVELDNSYNDLQFATQLPDYSTPSQGTIVGDTLEFNVPHGVGGYGTLQVDASRTATAVQCTGPTSCTLDVAAHATFTTTVQ